MMAPTKAKKAKQESWSETIKTIVYAILIALGIRTVAYEPFNIPSESMLPTLLVGDYLFVSKFSYGYSRYSLPFGLPILSSQGRLFDSQPERGDVAVFKLPRDNSTDYIKRIIGLPGDRIQVKNGVLFINDVEVTKRRIENFVRRNHFGQVESIAQFIETLPTGKQYRSLDLGNSEVDNTGVFTVPAEHYFALGDNRDNSLDSRVAIEQGGVGFIPAENLVGRADFLFFSIEGTARWWQPWGWPGAIRYDRIFQSLRLG